MEVAEVILVTQNEDINDVSTIIHSCLSIKAANAVLEDISFANLDEENCRAYRGIITNASKIPPKFLGCTPYIIVQIPDQDFENKSAAYIEAHFEKAPISPEKVQIRIQELLSNGIIFNDGYGVDHNNIPTIDDIFLFFGVQIPFVFKIGDQGTDEEFEDRLKSLCKSISDVKIVMEGDSLNMSRKVSLVITPKEGVAYKIEGRLLGGAITEEVTKIAQNIEIAEKIHTSKTLEMNTVVHYLSNIETANQRIATNLRTNGHFVMTLEAIKSDTDIVHAEVASRHLYISPPINITREFIDNMSNTRATFECTDGSIIVMKEQKS